MQLVLGSASPRRREILGNFNLPFVQATSHFDEASLPFRGDPQQYARAIALGKARALTDRFGDKIILTADTVVYHNERLYPKPSNQSEAQQTLEALAGNWHTVYTAVTLLERGNPRSKVVATRVHLHNLTPLQIRLYHRALTWADKAGAYAIQGVGGLIVDRIEGCYYNVMGLPLEATRQLLAEAGIDLWEHLKEL